MIGFSAREYQKNILQTALSKNTLVVLPTGLGKTLIALMLSEQRLKQFSDSKVLFLAPTKPLAEQHLNYFKKNLSGFSYEIFTGKINSKKRKQLWDSAQIIFSTPQCILNDLKNNLYSLKKVSLLVEDECHRCLKNYAYTLIANNYLNNSEFPRILGMTASPGSEEEKIKKICENLSISAIEIRNRESPDVKNYLQKLEIETIKVSLPPEFERIRDLIKSLYNKKIDELKSRNLLFGPANKKNLLDLQTKLIKIISSGNKHFNILRGMMLTSQAIKIQHAIELIETQTIHTFYSYIQKLFKNKTRSGSEITKSQEFNQAYIKTIEILKKEHPKLSKLKEIVSELVKTNSKVLIFAQYRSTVEEINKKLKEIGINSEIFIGQAKKEGKGLKQEQQKEIIKKFANNEILCLVSTSIGEEGLDIPEVSTVIFYEPIPSEIRKIQRQGRTARLKPGKVITLITEKTRDETYYWTSIYKEKKMHKILKNINESLKDNQSQKQINDFK